MFVGNLTENMKMDQCFFKIEGKASHEKKDQVAGLIDKIKTACEGVDADIKISCTLAQGDPLYEIVN